MYSFVVAIGENNEMGLDNHLPWHLPSEANYFREVTQHHTIIMGRRTFESLPNVLPNRRHIVVTSATDYRSDHPDVTVVHSVDELLALTSDQEEYMVIGGAEIFRLLLPYAQRIYLTVLHRSFKADTFWPELDRNQWVETKKWEGTVDAKNDIPHTYYVLDKKKETTS